MRSTSATEELLNKFLRESGNLPLPIDPVQLQASGWVVHILKVPDLEAPTPDEVLYFNGLKSQPMRGHPEKVRFYRLEKLSKAKCPTCHTICVPNL